MSKRLKDIHATGGETLLIANNWTAEAEKRGTTVSTSTWTYTGAGTLSGASLTVSKSAVNLAPPCHGVLTNTVSLANGETLIAERVVRVKPQQIGSVSA